MKKLFTLALVLWCCTTQAQYFEHLYGKPFDEALGDAKNTFANPGHVLAGYGSTFTLPYGQISVTHVDVNGTPYFNNEYELSDNMGNPMNSGETKVFEFPNGSGDFGVAGRFNDLPGGGGVPSSGVFYYTIDAAGNPINGYEYRVMLSGSSIWEVYNVSAIALSASGNEAYITGTMMLSFNETHIFILKIDINTGAIVWGWVYDMVNATSPGLDIAADIIESPSASEVYVVGNTYSPGQSIDAFLFIADAATGTPNGPAQLYGTTTDWDYFTSIDIANQVGGFIIGGYTGPAFSNGYDYWLTLIDPSGGIFWSNQYDYSFNPGSDNRCEDVIERVNQAGFYEYYAVGTAHSGVFGISDAVVVKTDNNGNGIGEFSYGDSWFQLGNKIDQMNNTGADGLCIFGIGDHALAPIGGSDLYMIKAYFNGETACNFMASTPNQMPGPGMLSSLTVNQISSFFDNIIFVATAPILDKQQCFARRLPAGDNSRIAPVQPKGDKEAVVSPNPLQQGTAYAVVELETPTPATVTVAIYDMLGKQYYNGQFNLAKGANQLPVDISKTNMAAGMYTIKVTGNNVSKNILLIVK